MFWFNKLARSSQGKGAGESVIDLVNFNFNRELEPLIVQNPKQNGLGQCCCPAFFTLLAFSDSTQIPNAVHAYHEYHLRFHQKWVGLKEWVTPLNLTKSDLLFSEKPLAGDVIPLAGGRRKGSP